MNIDDSIDLGIEINSLDYTPKISPPDFKYLDYNNKTIVISNLVSSNYNTPTYKLFYLYTFIKLRYEEINKLINDTYEYMRSIINDDNQKIYFDNELDMLNRLDNDIRKAVKDSIGYDIVFSQNFMSDKKSARWYLSDDYKEKRQLAVIINFIYATYANPVQGLKDFIFSDKIYLIFDNRESAPINFYSKINTYTLGCMVRGESMDYFVPKNKKNIHRMEYGFMYNLNKYLKRLNRDDVTNKVKEFINIYGYRSYNPLYVWKKMIKEKGYNVK